MLEALGILKNNEKIVNFFAKKVEKVEENLYKKNLKPT